MKVLLCKDNLSNTIVELKMLPESENIKYYIIENAPNIETREKEVGHYELNDVGELIVVYKPILQTIEEKLQEQEHIIADIMLEMAMLRGGTK